MPSQLEEVTFIMNVVLVFLSLVSLMWGIIKYYYLRKLRRQMHEFTFESLGGNDLIERSRKDPTFYSDHLTVDECRADLELIRASHPMSAVMSLGAFLSMVRVVNCPPWLDLVHRMWNVLNMAFFGVVSSVAQYGFIFQNQDTPNTKGSPASQIARDSRVLFFLLHICVMLMTMYVYLFFCRLVRSPRFLRIMHRSRENQVVEQGEFQFSLRNYFRTLYAFMVLMVMLVIAATVYDAATSTESFVQYSVFNSLGAWYIMTVILVTQSMAASISIHLVSDASMLAVAMQPVMKTMQSLVEQAEEDQETHRVNIELNPMFRHKHKHKYRPAEQKLTELLGGFNVNATFHSYGQMVDKVRFASRALSSGLFFMIPIMLIYFSNVILTWVGLSQFRLGLFFNVVQLFCVFVAPFGIVFSIYAQITSVLTRSKSIIVQTLSTYGLVLDDKNQDMRHSVMVEAIAHVPSYFALAGVKLDTAVLVKVGSIFASVAGLTIAFAT